MSQMEMLYPKTLEEAAAAVAESIRPLAGGTDFIPLVKLGLKKASPLLSLSKIPSLREIRVEAGAVTIGACASLTDIAQHGAIGEQLPALALAALAVGSPQLRNRGTIGGNLLQDRRCLYFNQSAAWRSSLEPCYKTRGSVCHQIKKSADCRAFYYSDVATALLALGATATIMRGRDTICLPLEELIEKHIAANGTDSVPGFLLTELTVPLDRPGASFFMKIAARASFDFPLLNLAAARPLGSLRIFAGAWGSLPLRLGAVESVAESKNCSTEELCAALKSTLEAQRSPIRETAIPPKVRAGLMPRLARFADAVRGVV